TLGLALGRHQRNTHTSADGVGWTAYAHGLVFDPDRALMALVAKQRSEEVELSLADEASDAEDLAGVEPEVGLAARARKPKSLDCQHHRGSWIERRRRWDHPLDVPAAHRPHHFVVVGLAGGEGADQTPGAVDAQNVRHLLDLTEAMGDEQD